VLVAFVSVAPDLVEQLSTTEDTTGVSSEMLEKIEFSRRELDGVSGERHFSPGRIDIDRAGGDAVARLSVSRRSLGEVLDTP